VKIRRYGRTDAKLETAILACDQYSKFRINKIPVKPFTRKGKTKSTIYSPINKKLIYKEVQFQKGYK
jgi:hypothetical protein